MYSLWAYDTNTQIWDHFDTSHGTTYRPSSGPYAEASELGLGFYFNGEIDSGSAPETQSLGDGVNLFLEGMVVIDTAARTTRNVSTSSVTGTNARNRGGLQYVPGIGEKGILVAFGGAEKPLGKPDNVEADDWVTLDQIAVFDVNSLFTTNGSDTRGWYLQNATG